MMRTILSAVLLVLTLTLPSHARQDTPPRLAPGSPDAKPLTVYQWTAAAGATDEHDGFRYTWRLPATFKRGQSYDLVVVCHPDGKDYLWGAASLPSATFRPNNIVVSMDGPAENDENGRDFVINRRDAIEFRDFVLEMSRSLPVDRIFLVGHAQGAAFVVFMAGQFPGLTEGVVASATTEWKDLDLRTGIRAVPIAFVHAAGDSVTPIIRAYQARATLTRDEHQKTLLCRIENGSHEPHAPAISACIDWVAGMSTTQAQTALAAAETILAPSADPDAPHLHGGAFRILQRVTLETEEHVEDADEPQKARAKSLIEAIDSLGAVHVEMLKKDVKSAGDLVLGLGDDSGAWLGHLVLLREEFRAVPSVERYLTEIGYDDAAAAHVDAGVSLVETWYAARPEKQKFEVVARSLGECFLYPALPPGLEPAISTLRARAAELELTEESIEQAGAVETWAAAWRHGVTRYREICRPRPASTK